MKKAFTLIELLVAIAILAMVLVFTSVIFKVSIGAHRTSVANAEIMQKLRAITDQLNADFKGLQKDAPLLIQFEQDDLNRYDQIMFFADGDFQSTQVYSGRPVIGNVARIFYGQAQSRDPSDGQIKDPLNLKEEDRIIARRLHILTADSDLVAWLDFNFTDFDYANNESYEYDSLSLAEWKTVEGNKYNNTIVDTCFDFRPKVDTDDEQTLHKLMCEGVGSFAIQWAYWDTLDDQFYWFPSDDADSDGSNSDSHFELNRFNGRDEFGVFFNVLNGSDFGKWCYIKDENVKYKSSKEFLPEFYPEALKFTFKLYDSKGILEGGRTFTHIVYLGE